MTARAAAWLGVILCIGLSGCAERPGVVGSPPPEPCTGACQVSQAPLDIHPAASGSAGRRTKASASRHRRPMHLAAAPRPIATKVRPRLRRPHVHAEARAPRDADTVVLVKTPPAERPGTVLPGATDVVPPWFEPWPRPSI